MRAADWMRLKLGDIVHDVADPRHLGEVRAIAWSNTATVRWLDTGWLSEVEKPAVAGAERCIRGKARAGLGVHAGLGVFDLGVCE